MQWMFVDFLMGLFEFEAWKFGLVNANFKKLKRFQRQNEEGTHFKNNELYFFFFLEFALKWLYPDMQKFIGAIIANFIYL